MARILVTGATGFVGKNLVPALIQQGHEVRCVVSKKVDWLRAEQVVMKRLEFETDWSRALVGMDVVIHLAARVHILNETAASASDEYYKINTVATRNLAEQAALHQVKRFIFLSSIKVNGEFTVDGSPFVEEINTKPDDPYGQSKLYAEQALQDMSKTSSMQVVIVRPPLVYGPEVKANFLKMLQLIHKKIPLPFACVRNKRHFVYIDNLVSALCTVATHPDAANQTYLVADDDSFSIPELMRLIAQEMHTRIWLIPVPVVWMKCAFQLLGRKNLNTRLFSSLEINNNKIKSQLGWNPPVRSVDGLKTTVAWYQSEFNS